MFVNRNLDAKRASIIAISVALLALAMFFSAVVRAVVVVPLLVVVPGFALSAAWFAPRALGWVERTVLSIGLSLATLALGGLVLQWTGLGLHPSTWIVLLLSVTLLSGAAAFMRHRSTLPRATFHGVAITRQQSTMFGVAALVTAGALSMAVWSAVQPSRTGFTQLWLVPASTGTASSTAPTVHLGVSNQESVPTSYQLRLTLGNQTIHEWKQLDLAPYTTWETDVTLPTTGTAQAFLYRSDAPTAIYRRVQLATGAPSAATPPSEAGTRP